MGVRFPPEAQDMSWTKEQLLPYLDPNRNPLRGVLLERGRKYLGRDVPDEYFMIQDWCVSQGVATESFVPDLTHVLQGVEYVLLPGTGRHPELLTTDVLTRMMYYLNREDEFEGGALRQYPELQTMIKEEVLKQPDGRLMLDILAQTPEYKDLFK